MASDCRPRAPIDESTFIKKRFDKPPPGSISGGRWFVRVRRHASFKALINEVFVLPGAFILEGAHAMDRLGGFLAAASGQS